MPVIDYSLPASLPTFTIPSETGPPRTVHGQEAEPFFSPESFTLSACTLQDKKLTHYERTVQLLEAYIAEKIGKILHFKKNKPSELQGWKCPKNDMMVDFREEAEKLLNTSLPKCAEPIIHEAFPYNELSHTGTVLTVLKVVENLKMDVIKIMDDVATKKHDGSMHVLAGDLATIEGTYSNHDLVCWEFRMPLHFPFLQQKINALS